jgi:hypothetical protein
LPSGHRLSTGRQPRTRASVSGESSSDGDPESDMETTEQR